MHILHQYIKLLIETHSTAPTPTLAHPIGKGFCFPVWQHGELSSMSIDPSQKSYLIDQALKRGIIYEGIGEPTSPGETGKYGEVEQAWLASQLNLKLSQIKIIGSFDDLLLETYPDKDHFAYATFADLNHLPHDQSFNSNNPKKYIHSVLSVPVNTFQSYNFSKKEIDKFINDLSRSDPSVLTPGRFKTDMELAEAIYCTIFDEKDPKRDNCTMDNLVGNNTDKLLHARQDNLIDMLKQSGGIAFIGGGHFQDIINKTKPKTK